MIDLQGHCLVCRRLAMNSYRPTGLPLLVSYCSSARCQKIAVVTAELYGEIGRAMSNIFKPTGRSILKADEIKGMQERKKQFVALPRTRYVGPRLAGAQ